MAEDEIVYICWENYSVPVRKNILLIKIEEDYNTVVKRNEIFESIRSKFTDQVSFGEVVYGWLYIQFDFEIDEIRTIIRTMLTIDGIEIAEPDHVVMVAKNAVQNYPSGPGNALVQQYNGFNLDTELVDFSGVFRNEVGCQIVTIENNSDRILTTQIRIGEADSSYFKILSDFESIELAPESTVQLELQFRPDSLRAFESYLYIDPAGLESSDIKIPLKGRGIPGSTSVESVDEYPVSIILKQNYPNPFNPSTRIRFAVEQMGHVELSIYNMVGQKVATLVNTTMPIGWHEVSFDAGSLSSGTYIYSLNSDNKIIQKLMTLIK